MACSAYFFVAATGIKLVMTQVEPGVLSAVEGGYPVTPVVVNIFKVNGPFLTFVAHFKPVICKFCIVVDIAAVVSWV